ncbi:hypothetical protein B0H19DRAFT_1187486 [Mycena capillaripes]|nr:hypothetical protein B0H19DRAFT_1187486 [Mycena capillaripes]
MCTFQHFPEDIILLVFSLCDVSAVISNSETNRYLRQLALDRSVWVALVQDLRFRGFLDQSSAADVREDSH